MAATKKTNPASSVKAEENKKPVAVVKKPVAAKAEAEPAKAEVKAEAKKTETAKAEPKKAAAKKAEAKSELHVQFGGKSYADADLFKIARDVWKYDLKQKAGDLTSIELYVKPEENLVYYVMNKDFTGSFNI